MADFGWVLFEARFHLCARLDSRARERKEVGLELMGHIKNEISFKREVVVYTLMTYIVGSVRSYQ